MPNRAAQLRAEIEREHPGARLKHRGEAGFSMLSADGRVEYHKYTTGPWHWRQTDTDEWAEIDTDLESRPNVKWNRGIRFGVRQTNIAYLDPDTPTWDAIVAFNATHGQPDWGD
jgi:hypothetical protein